MSGWGLTSVLSWQAAPVDIPPKPNPFLKPKPPLLPPVHPEVQSLLDKGEIVDLTESVKLQAAIPCYGRDNDVKWIAIRVASPQKNSVLITGSAGVGKTRLYYHIAQLIVTDRAPLGLRGRRILLLCSEPKKVLDILSRYYSKECVLVSDEVHTILKKEGWFGSQLDQSEELKPFIGSGKTPFIGFTDRPDAFIKDNAWLRRFHIRTLPEMSISDSIKALLESKVYLQSKINQIIEETYKASGIQVEISLEAIALSVKLSFVYIPEEYLPDKSSKILEPACIGKVMQCLQAGVDDLYASPVIKVSGEDIKLYVQQEYRVTQQEVEDTLKDLESALQYTPIPLTEPLMKYTTNLNEKVRRGDLLPAYGRDDEMQKVTTILCARRANNAILRGYAGSGKSRIGEGLAYNIVHKKNIPPSLENVQVLELDLNSLIGDTKYRGELEAKYRDFFRSAEKYAGHFILVIDEIHRLVGSGLSESNTTDTANQFKTMLARGKLRVVGMTTPYEFSSLERDPAFLRRFQTLDIDPFSVPQTIEVIRADKKHYQESYQRPNLMFRINDSACEAAAFLAVHYLPREYLPASAYKIFDSACAYAEAHAPAGQSIIVVDDSTVVNYVTYFFKKEKNERTLRQVTNDLMRLKAELHPSNQLIPLHEPVIRFSENWINKARQGDFKPSVHREKDVQRLIEILNCKTVNNVLLMGRSGSGKTSLAQQVALLMANGQIFKNRLFLALKFQDFLDEARKTPSTISSFIDSLHRCAGSFVLFIDEFHNFFQVQTPDGVPLYDLFKPILAEGKVRLIGATTKEEARAYILNKGEAVLRRFAPHYLFELTDVQSVDALAGSKEAYESHYSEQLGRKVVIDPSAFPTAVQEAKKRLSHQALPSSAITLFEEACSAKGMDDSPGEIKVTPEDILRFAEERYPLPKPIPPTSWMTIVYGFFAKCFRFFFK